MIIIQAKDNVSAFKQAFFKLWGMPAPDDEELVRESPAILMPDRFLLEERVGLDIPAKRLVYDFPWQQYFPYVDNELITEEIRYWSNEIFGRGDKYGEMVNYLRDNPTSKRAIVNFWEDEFKDLSIGASCLVSVFFRIDRGRLNAHVHARVSNASFLFFMDLQVMRAFQNVIAEGIGNEVGEFIYFTSSLHAYIAEKQKLEQLRSLFNKESVWQTLNMN